MNESRILTREDTTHNLYLPFFVPAGYRALLFQFSYEPELVDCEEEALKLFRQGFEKYAISEYISEYPPPAAYFPLRNLLTLSVFAPEGYLGCAHRMQPAQEHMISRERSSNGYLKHLITAGGWKAVVNVHCVVTEKCAFRLRICALKEGETA